MPALPQIFLERPIAHRGLHDAAQGVAENSRAACAAAVAQGCGVEIDVRLSADGEAVVFHDQTLERVTHERGLVRERWSGALRDVALIGDQDGVPSLPDVLDLIAYRTPVLIELKFAPEEDPTLLCGRVLNLLREYRGQAAAMSFSQDAMRWLTAQNPDFAVGYVLGDTEDLAKAATCAADFTSCDWRLTPDAQTLRTADAPMLCWTIKSLQDAKTALTHADGITFEGFPAQQACALFNASP